MRHEVRDVYTIANGTEFRSIEKAITYLEEIRGNALLALAKRILNDGNSKYSGVIDALTQSEPLMRQIIAARDDMILLPESKDE